MKTLNVNINSNDRDEPEYLDMNQNNIDKQNYTTFGASGHRYHSSDKKIRLQNVQLNTLNSLNRSPTPKSIRNESLNISRSFEDLDK